MQNNSERLKILTYLLILAPWLLISFDSVFANVRAHLNYSIFNSPLSGPYIETYLAIDGTSVVFNKTGSGSFQAIVEVTMVFRRDGKVVEFDKYQLKSKEVNDTSTVVIDLLDQQRYFISSGEYEFEITLNDTYSKEEPLVAAQIIKIDFPGDEICFSAIQLVDSISQAEEPGILTKSGFDLYPKVLNHYPEHVKTIRFYTEIYNTPELLGENGRFLLTSYIKTFESNFLMNDYVAYKRAQAKEVYPHLQEFNISNLPTGNYILGVEVHDRENNLLALNAIFFRRDNPEVKFQVHQIEAYSIENTFVEDITDPDTLDEYIRCLAPAATGLEQQFIFKDLEKSTLAEKQKFFYYFWSMRFPQDPEEAWLRYLEMVEFVNENYSTQISRGYETDRGRVYLKYGPPNITTESYSEPSSYPYEIWQYYKLGNNQSNRRFVFYTHDLITNDFQLLHSDAVGEVSNYRWQVILNSRWFDPYSLDVTAPPDIWGSRAEDYYRNPR